MQCHYWTGFSCIQQKHLNPYTFFLVFIFSNFLVVLFCCIHDFLQPWHLFIYRTFSPSQTETIQLNTTSSHLSSSLSLATIILSFVSEFDYLVEVDSCSVYSSFQLDNVFKAYSCGIVHQKLISRRMINILSMYI